MVDGPLLFMELLFSLVEDCVKHGIAPAKKSGHIVIKCKELKETCEISIWDTGKGFVNSEEWTGFGSRSVIDRLALYYGRQHT